MRNCYRSSVVHLTFREPQLVNTNHNNDLDTMALALVRRMSRFTWLRLLVSLAIYMLAVPGTVRSTMFVSAAATPSANAPPVAAKAATTRSIADDEVRVFYCTSCGFQQNFQEVKTFLEDRYPHLVDRVYGANYEVDPMKKVLWPDASVIYATHSLSLLTVTTYAAAPRAVPRLRPDRRHGPHGLWRVCTYEHHHLKPSTPASLSLSRPGLSSLHTHTLAALAARSSAPWGSTPRCSRKRWTTASAALRSFSSSARSRKVSCPLARSK